MISVLASPFLSWVQSSTWLKTDAAFMVGEIGKLAQLQFAKCFTNLTDAKIYFFVVVNKKVLFEDSISMRFVTNEVWEAIYLKKDIDLEIIRTTDPFWIRHNECAMADKENDWQKKIHALAIPFFSEINLVMQAIIRKPTEQGIEFEVPVVFNHRYCIGLAENGRYWGRLGVPTASNQLKGALCEQLMEHDIPWKSIKAILDEAQQ